MTPASLVPSLDADVHLVLCRFGRAGLAYVETNPAEADATTVVQNLLHGRYAQPLRVTALNVDEGWSQDVSEAMAHKVREIAEHEDYELTSTMIARPARTKPRRSTASATPTRCAIAVPEAHPRQALTDRWLRGRLEWLSSSKRCLLG